MNKTTNLTELNEFFPPTLAQRKPQWVAARYRGETQAQANARVARAKALREQQAKDSTGKWYIWLNDSSPKRYYWSQPAQNWTTAVAEATLFATSAEAHGEARYADYTTKAEVIVSQATKNVFA